MRKFITFLTQEILYTLRHPNREIFPLLFYALVTFLGLNIGYSRLLPNINMVDSVTWMIPNLVIFYFIILTFHYGKSSINRKNSSGYLAHLRIVNSCGASFFFALVFDSYLKAAGKSTVIVLIYWLLWGQVESYQSWLLVLALSVPLGLFWIGIGFMVGIRQDDSDFSGQVLGEIIIPLLAISGLLYPVAYYPAMIEQITYYLPMTLGFYLARTFFGIGVQEIWMLAALSGWGLVSIMIAYKLLRRRNY